MVTYIDDEDDDEDNDGDIKLIHNDKNIFGKIIGFLFSIIMFFIASLILLKSKIIK